MDHEQHHQWAHLSHPDAPTSVGPHAGHTPARPLQRLRILAALIALLPLLFSACTPSGPKALEQGEAALNQGFYPEAIRVLSIAVDKLPREARAWNLLGLAYHGNNQSELAAQAYSKALALDHKLSAARYNLGVLLLEKNQLQPAINELTAFTLLQPRNIDGWLQLANAHMRINKSDAADACYRTILNLQPKHPEALNGLGVISVQRRRYVDAIQFFQAALAENPSYAPALLNQAVVIHRNLNQKATALQKYRQYLALQPRPENWDAVNHIAQALTDELTPGTKPVTATVPTTTNRPPNLTTTAAPTRPTNTPPTVTSTPSPSRPSPPTTVSPRATPTTATPTPTPTPTLTPTPPVARLPIPVPNPNPIQPQPAKPEITIPKPNPTAVEPPPPTIEVAEIPKPLEIQPTRDLPSENTPNPTATAPTAATPAPTPAPAPAPATPTPAPVASSLPSEERRGFFSRLNPFRSNRSKPESVPTPNPAPSTSVATKSPTVAPTPPPVPRPQPTPNPTPTSATFPRYTYLNPPKPRPGDRQKAAILVNKGIEAHNSRELDEEIGFYRSATLTDPSSYDAFFNLGLASAERGDWSAALEAYEHALSIDPESPNSRYNLGVALRQSGYPIDAAQEFQKILQANPTEPKALLALGNLHAQRFNQPKVARQYYQRLLETSPNHPKAAEIRFWLTTNP